MLTPSLAKIAFSLSRPQIRKIRPHILLFAKITPTTKFDKSRTIQLAIIAPIQHILGSPHTTICMFLFRRILLIGENSVLTITTRHKFSFLFLSLIILYHKKSWSVKCNFVSKKSLFLYRYIIIYIIYIVNINK